MTNGYRIRLIGGRRLFLILFIALQLPALQAQVGCTDPQAINYDATATVSDGSCEYATTNLSSMELAKLPIGLDECSGFVLHDDFAIGINDSGSPAELYLLDTTDFELIEKKSIIGMVNVDWEELQRDDDFLYIADFGNNFGTRTNLIIHKVLLPSVEDAPLPTQIIEFSYENQTNFSSSPFSTPFDCEAFVVAGDSIHLFTKGWDNNYTKHYKMPNVSGDHVAELVDSFFVDGLITGATLVSDSLLVLTGYGTESFIWLMKDYSGNEFLQGNKRRFMLGDLGQNETVTWQSEGKCLITNEGGLGLGEVYLINLEDFVTETDNHFAAHPIHCFPNPVEDQLTVDLGQYGAVDLSIVDVYGRRLLSAEQVDKLAIMDMSLLPTGLYFLRASREGQIASYVIWKK